MTTVFYFSGTGNSYHIAKNFGGDMLINLARAEANTYAADVIGLVLPVYCYDMPAPVEAFLKRVTLKADYIFAIATCGGGQGNTLNRMDALLKEKGARLAYGTQFIMPDNDILFPTPPEKQAALFAAEEERLAKIRADVAARKISKIKRPLFAKTVTRVAWWYLRRVLNPQQADKSRCTACGICEKVCPVDNIAVSKENRIAAFKGQCASCFACIQYCPERAITFKKQKVTDKTAYTHPGVTVAEMVKNNKRENSNER